MWMRETVLERRDCTLQDGESVFSAGLPSSLQEELRSWQVKFMGPLIKTFRANLRQFQPIAFIPLVSPEITLTATFLFTQPVLSNDVFTIQRYPAADPQGVLWANKKEIQRMQIPLDGVDDLPVVSFLPICAKNGDYSIIKPYLSGTVFFGSRRRRGT